MEDFRIYRMTDAFHKIAIDEIFLKIMDKKKNLLEFRPANSLEITLFYNYPL